MQVELKKLEGLKRELKVTIPFEQVKDAYDKHLKETASKLKIKGFRPGKVPPHIVDKKFRSSLTSEVAASLTQSTIEKVILQEQLQIVGMPDVKLGELKKGEAFEYVASFEIYPVIQLQPFSQVSITKITSSVTDEDVAKMLEKICKNRPEWHAVEREAQEGDRLLIDFVGLIDNKTFDGGIAKDFTLILGKKRMIPGFEEGLVGAKLNEMKVLEVVFPDNYQEEKLAGKNASFEVTVRKIEEPRLPELNDEFAKLLGFEKGVEELREGVREEMEHDLEANLDSLKKEEVLDKLIELNPIDLPETLLDMEIKELQKYAKESISKQQNLTDQQLEKIQLPKEIFLKQATRRVKLGLLLREVINQYGLTIDEEAVNQRIRKIASAYKHPEEVIAWYRNSKQKLSEVEALVVEDGAVSKLVEQAQLIEKYLSYDEVVQLSELKDKVSEASEKKEESTSNE